MKKKCTLLLTVLFTLFTLPINGLTVFAEEKSYENGEYDVPIQILDASKDKESTMQAFIKDDKATVTIQEDVITVVTSLTNADMIKKFEIQGVPAEIIHDDEENKERTYSFLVEDLDEITFGVVGVDVPGLYSTEHNIRLTFDTSTIPTIVEEDVNDDSDDNTNEEGDPSPEEDASDEEGETDVPEEGNTEDETDESTDENEEEIENGFYTIDINYLNEKGDGESSMARHLHKEAFVNVKDDKVEVTITVNNHDTVTKLVVGGQNSVQAKLDGDKRYETFELNGLSENVSAYVEYQAPYQGGIHKGNADFQLSFDEETLVKVSENDQPGYDINQTLIQLDEGFFMIDTAYLKTGTNEKSAMGSYLGDFAFIEVNDNQYFVTVTITDNDAVTKLQVNGKDAEEVIDDGNQRYETFVLDDLFSKESAYVEYQAPFGDGVFEGDADFDIAFDSQSVTAAKAEDNPGSETDKEDPKEDPKEEPKEEPKEPKQEPKKDDALTPDKAYEINYTLMHENGSKPSVADGFFEKPGKLLEKDGKLYAQFTINNGDMVRELRTEDYGKVLLVEKNDDGSIVVQFRVNDDLSDMNLSMKVVVPGLYEEVHKAILVFDKESKKEINIDNLSLIPAINENGPTVDGIEEGKELGSGNDEDDESDTPTKPEFGSNDKNIQEVAASGNDDKKNPQTGDTSAIMFYTLLLIGSLIPLALKFKRRFA